MRRGAMLFWLATLTVGLPQPRLTGGGLAKHMRALPGAVLIVDGNNVRGADCFGTSQEELCTALEAWSASQQLATILMLDHGTEQHAVFAERLVRCLLLI